MHCGGGILKEILFLDGNPDLFLRWMVRSDEIDPGGWEDANLAQLLKEFKEISCENSEEGDERLGGR